MNRLSPHVALLCTLVWLASCASTPAVPPTPLEPIEAPSVLFETVWQTSLPGKARFDGASYVPALADGIVYASSASGTIKTLSFNEGKTLWETEIDRPLSSGISVDTQSLYVTARDGSVLALDREFGKLRWEATLDREMLHAPLVEAGQVLVGTTSGELYALDTVDGAPLWQFRYQAPNLTVRGAGYTVHVPGGYFAALDDGRLVALEERSGNLIWERYISTPRGRTAVQRIVDVDSPPVVIGETVVVGSRRGDVTSVDGRTGEQRWTRVFESVAGLTGDEEAVVVVERDSTVIGLDADTGEQLWTTDALRGRLLSDPIMHRGAVVLGDLDGYVHALSPRTGALVGRSRVSDDAVQAQLISAGPDVLVQSRNGDLARLAVVGGAR
ncbi:MAG: outer membrane protein assembly factor BamB [Pseudomonadota bacterium]